MVGVISGSSEVHRNERDAIYQSNQGQQRWAEASPMNLAKRKVMNSLNTTRNSEANGIFNFGKVPKTAGSIVDGVFTSIPSGIGSRITSPQDTLAAIGNRTGAGFNQRKCRMKQSLNFDYNTSRNNTRRNRGGTTNFASLGASNRSKI
jgi:hypothetical protein